LIFHAYINEMHGSRSKIPSKKSRPYIYIYIYMCVCVCVCDVKFLALLGAPYIYDISRLRVKHKSTVSNKTHRYRSQTDRILHGSLQAHVLFCGLTSALHHPTVTRQTSLTMTIGYMYSVILQLSQLVQDASISITMNSINCRVWHRVK
jgi:hypothetical protein